MLCRATGTCAQASISLLGAQTDEVSSVADAAEAKRRWRAQQDDATFPDEVSHMFASTQQPQAAAGMAVWFVEPLFKTVTLARRQL